MIKVAKSLVRSDHKMIIAYLRQTVKAKRTDFYFRDVRQQRKLNMWKELKDVDWNEIHNEEQSLDEMVEKFYATIWPKFEKSFPMIKVRMSTKDPPFISPLVKHLLKQTKRAIILGYKPKSISLFEETNLKPFRMNIENSNQEKKTGGLT